MLDGPGAVFARSEACETAWDRRARAESSKDGTVPYKTRRETGYAALRRLRCRRMVLYGDWQQWYATVRCYTAGGRTIISSASTDRLSWGEQAYSILSQYPAIFDIATYLSLNKVSGFFREGVC